MPVRWRRCSSTTVWTSFRWRCSPHAQRSYWTRGRPRRAPHAKRLEWGACSSGRAASRKPPSVSGKGRSCQAMPWPSPRTSTATLYWRAAIVAMRMPPMRGDGCSRFPNAPPALRREATEALAVHHEHRARDLAAARQFAVESLGLQATGPRRQAIEHRLARIDRKLGADSTAPLF